MKLFSVLFLLIFIQSYICQENKTKIFDDSDKSIDLFPWMTSIRFGWLEGSLHVCSGAIVSDIYILTAASCFDVTSDFLSFFSIKAGIHNLFESQPTEQL